MEKPQRAFSPIFAADVTFNGPIATATTGKGVEYAKSQGATVRTDRGAEMTRTIMAFGDQLAEVRDSIAEGATVRLAVQHDGGSMKIIGFPREKQRNAA